MAVPGIRIAGPSGGLRAQWVHQQIRAFWPQIVGRARELALSQGLPLDSFVPTHLEPPVRKAREPEPEAAENPGAPEFNAAFWRWFGDSKVVDAQGHPLVVYHGADAEFDAFDNALAVDGAHFFTGNELHAGRFGVISAYYLSIKNPKVISQDDLNAAWDEDHEEDGSDKPGKEGGPDFPSEYIGRFVREAKRDGHDGLIVEKLNDIEFFEDVYLPFSPEQIKSVENDGTWDQDDPSIVSNPEPVGKLHRLAHRLGCGVFGCVYKTQSGQAVFKLGMDEGEAGVFNYYLHHSGPGQREWPPGLIRCLGAYRLPIQEPYYDDCVSSKAVSKQWAHGIWRQEYLKAISATEYADELEAIVARKELNLLLGDLDKAITALLQYRASASGLLRELCIVDGTPVPVHQQRRDWAQLQDWIAYGRDMSERAIEARQHGRPFEADEDASDFSKWYSAVRYSARVLANRESMSHVGRFLMQALDDGILVADTHLGNVALAETSIGRIAVLIDPGASIALTPEAQAFFPPNTPEI